MTTNTSRTRAAIYARVSNPKQEDGASPATQEAESRAYAAELGYLVIESQVQRETFTGADLWRRPKLTALREAIARRELDVVIVHHTDRLTRDPQHKMFLFVEASRAGVRYESVKDPLDNTLNGQLISFVGGYAAAVERTQISERSQRGVRARAESGKLLARGKPPFGYRWRDESKSALEFDDETAPLAQRIFHEVANGTSMTKVAARLNEEGIPTPKRGKYGWTTATISYLIKNPAYKGEAWAYRWQTAKAKTGGQRQVQRDPAEWVALAEGAIPPLVSEAEWEAANVLRAGNKYGSIRNNRNPEAFLLRSGFARCGYCDHALIGRSRPGTAPYYCCSKRGCPHHSIAARTLDDAVWDRMSQVLGDSDFFRQYIEPEVTEDALKRDLTRLDRSLADLERRRTNLSKYLGDLDDEDAAAPVLVELRELATRAQSLREEHDAIETRIADYKATASRIEGMLRWCEIAHRRLDTMSYDEKRAWLAQLGVKARVWKSDHEPRYEIEMNVDPSFWEPWIDRDDDHPMDGLTWWFGGNEWYPGEAVATTLERAARRSRGGRRSPPRASTGRG